MRGDTWGFGGQPVEHIETHAAHVFLVGDRAFKMKKAVKLPYLDFSTIEKRKAVLEHELEINRAFAPSVYLRTDEIRGEPVLVMNRFKQEELLSSQSGGIADSMARELARMVVESHVIAPRRETPGSEIMAGLGAQLSKAFADSPDIFPADEAREFQFLHQQHLTSLSPLLDQRSAQGLVRRCHGDMHCGNIVLLDGKPVLFDAIEFSEKIATIDVLYDLAFLLMDLGRRDEKRVANLVFNRYLHLRRAEEDLSGLAALPLFLATRAGVRALVAADLAHELEADASANKRKDALEYFHASIAWLKPDQPRLICVGGLSGSGKSTLAARLAHDIGLAPGALHVRSDVERKVLAGVDETVHLPPESYSAAASAATYRAIFQRADAALKAGHSVVLDAVFAREDERDAAEELVRSVNARFTGLWLAAPSAILKSRVTGRRGDASDADAAVVEKQLGYQPGEIRWKKVDVSGSVAASETLVRKILQL
ncbi:MAG: AAA family ATPase [Aestuariivirga sp.]|nr:AAA family ATPase [Aestuariivirga sp.]